MSLEMNDNSTIPGITIENAVVRIDSYSVSNGAPIIEREDSTFVEQDILDGEWKPTGEKFTTEIEGKIKKTTKTYNVNLNIQFISNDEVYARDIVSINGLAASEITLKRFYVELKKVDKFQDATDC